MGFRADEDERGERLNQLKYRDKMPGAQSLARDAWIHRPWRDAAAILFSVFFTLLSKLRSRVLLGKLVRGLLIAGLLAATAPWLSWAGESDELPVSANPPFPADPEEALVERFYRAGDLFRAETEILRLLHAGRKGATAERQPTAGRQPNLAHLELARAKLYHRAGRRREADLMLYSLLDRHGRRRESQPVVTLAARLLTFSQVRQGQLDEAARWWSPVPGPSRHDPSTPPLPPLSDLRGDPPGVVDPESAKAWSTWLPGSGFFVAERPGKAWGAMTLNLVLLGAAVEFARAERPGAALAFLFLEALVYQGGRNGAREDAEALNRGLRERRTAVWLAAHGEGDLLRIGIEHRF